MAEGERGAGGTSELGADRCRAGERGSATVVMVGVLAAVAVLCIAVAAVVTVMAARARAQTAADLAAIAAASAFHSLASADPCAIARRVAEVNGATLTQCRTSGADVVASTQVATPWGPARASARAGPQ